jgi:diguanylate cyclase (GGDEF)-like protein
MQGTTVSADISPQCTANADVLRLYWRWREQHRAAGLPFLRSFNIDEMWCSGDLMLVEMKAPDDFRYLRYGTNIVLASGFDMTGKRTIDFNSDTGRFFSQCYRRSIGEQQALYTTNVAAHAALVTAWERLLLPLADGQGAPRYVLGYNRPLSFKHELLMHVLDASGDIIIAVELASQTDDLGPDCTVLSINLAAEQFFRRRRADIIGHSLLALMPQWRSTTWGLALVDSLRTGTSAQVEWHRKEDVVRESWARVAVNPFAGGIVITMSDITELKSKEQALEQMNRDLERLANTDPLTAASNRRHFLSIAETEALRSRRYTLPLSVVAIDVDRFKQLNDRFGHAAGDKALQAIVQLFNRTLRANDTLGRLGGDEFAILLPHTQETEAYDLARRLCVDLACQRLDLGESSVEVTCSFGVAEFTNEDASFSALQQRADLALYHAKQQGRKRVACASDIKS